MMPRTGIFRTSTKLSPPASLLAAILTCALSLLMLLSFISEHNHSRPPDRTSDVRLSEGISPIWDLYLPPVSMYFEDSVRYGLNGSDADAEWAALLPPDGGCVRFGPVGATYMPSMFHQLACLDLLRQSYVARESALAGGSPVRVTSCLNYIRQTVYCRRDVRLEPVVDPDGSHAVQPWGPKSCKDWRRVYEEQERSSRGGERSQLDERP
ncbi:unnamed protein product [Peniophora sp. CBMAI 1063]|nr:unnamed protein product [Peniophora sp. CBMAI 1063]